MFIKLGEATIITQSDIQSADTILADAEILERFKKFAANLKTIAPMAKDFLYFTAIMMHAAEAALLDKDGEIKKNANGEPIEAHWEKVGNDSVKWVCSDSNIRPVKNANGDIFPEFELVSAHKKWIGKPLCVDHKSSSVDAVRGVIIDTYYDRKHKRVIALCALDRVNYPELSRKVATGYQTCVSMGTAVGRAICTESGCHKAARVESDFCQHMRNKSCYGEINLDLSPIELSIVVNGADPNAKIKHIIAKDLSKAADSLQIYMDSKLSQGNISAEDIDDIKKDLESLTERVSKLSEKEKNDDDVNNAAYGMTRSLTDMAEPAETGSAQPPPNLPSNLVDWSGKIEDLTVKLSTLQTDLEKLIKISNKEITMVNKQEKKAYFQGAGGENEPTPGKPRYPAMSIGKTNEQIREEDKHMVGASPFPGVGPVDGLYPTDEARKKELQRLAEIKERQMRRLAALEKAKDQISEKKEAYFQGGGGPNEPTPGKPKYPEMKVDNKTNEQIREEDKHMAGKAPFPGVGKVDGLYGDDMKVKEMLSRASLKAKFVKAINSSGQTDLGRSRWDVYADKNLILSATVSDITGGNVSDVLYNSIATEKFGKDVLTKIKSEGFDAVRSALIKKAQMPAAQNGPAATSTMLPGSDATPPPVDMPMGDLDAPKDKEAPSGGGDPQEHVKDLIEKIKDEASETARMADDLGEAYSAMKDEVPELDGVKPAHEDDFKEGEAKLASVYDLQRMRKTLNGMLSTSMKEAIAELRACNDELVLAAGVYTDKYAKLNREQRKYLDSLATDSVLSAKQTRADAKNLMSAFIKYAHGTDGLLKRAASEGKIRKLADDMPTSVKKPDDHMEGKDYPTSPGQKPSTTDVKPGEIKPKDKDLNNAETNYGLLTPEERGQALQYGRNPHDTSAPPVSVPPKAGPDLPTQHKETMAPIEVQMANDGMSVELPGGSQVAVGEGTNLSTLPQGSKVAAIDLNTKAGRAAYRMKLAQKGVEWNEMTGKAHPKGGFTPSEMGKPEGDLAKVETITENHDAIMELANMSPKVRKQAEQIRQLVSEGKLAAADVDKLVSHGVDAAAVSYWKKYWAEAKDADSKEFANKLVSEQVKQKTAAEKQVLEVRIKRAYDLAYEMRDREIINDGQIKSQVDEILGWNDAAFESTKRIIAKQAIKKNAMPQVGFLHSDEIILPGSEQSNERTDLVNVFSNLFANKRY